MSDEIATRGRPSLYTPEIAELILLGVSEGKSLRKICEPEDMPSEAAVRRWVMDDHEGFAAHYTRSRDIGLDCRADAIIEDAKAAKDAGLGRLSFDADRWYLSKLAPKRYGDKLTTELTGADGGPIQSAVSFDPSKLSTGALQELLAATGGSGEK